MSLTRKSLRDTADRPLQALPEMPVFVSLTAPDREQLTEWWRKTRDIFDRQDDAIRLLVEKLEAQLDTKVASLASRINEAIGMPDQEQPVTQPTGSTTIVSGGNGVTEDRVVTIVQQAIEAARHVHNQGFPSATWAIAHNLGWKPSVTIIDSMDNIVMGDVRHISTTQLEVTFSSQFSGTAYLT